MALDTENDDEQASAVDPKLLELLVCPLTKTPLIYDASARELISKAAGLAFPIRNGVPLMIEDAARPLTDRDLQKR
ncbi:MAG: Trm112 family protein [Hyphomicrobium denitrificans]|nr:Trm112 family protein [Hyphomicrobium denitrificans]